MPPFWTSRKKNQSRKALTKPEVTAIYTAADKSQQPCDSVTLPKLPNQEKLRSRFIITDKVLGTGAYGSVFLGEDTFANRRDRTSSVAIKCIPEGRMKSEALQREIGIMKRLSKHPHPHVASYRGCVEPGSSDVCAEDDMPVKSGVANCYCIALELASGGEMFSRIVAANGLDEATAAPLMRQIALGLMHAHQNGVAHRDLKLENVLLAEDCETADAQLKIIDWGLAHQHEVLHDGTIVPEMLNSRCGSRSYMAPEVHKRGSHGCQGYNAFAADVWSFGVCVFACLLGFFPFEQADPEQDWRARKVVEAQMRGESTTATIFAFYPKRRLSCSPEAAALMDACLSFDPRRRCTLVEAIYSDWLSPLEEPINAEHFERACSLRKPCANPPAVERQDSQSTEKSGSSVGSSVICSVHRLRDLAQRETLPITAQQLVRRTAFPRQRPH